MSDILANMKAKKDLKTGTEPSIKKHVTDSNSIQRGIKLLPCDTLVSGYIAMACTDANQQAVLFFRFMRKHRQKRQQQGPPTALNRDPIVHLHVPIRTEDNAIVAPH